MLKIHVTNFGMNTALRCSTKKGQYYVEPHLHQFSEIVYVKEGSLEATVEGVKEVANEGDIVFISAFRTHMLSARPNSEIWICIFSNDFISDFKDEGDVYYMGERAVFTPSDIVRDFFVSRFIDSAEKFLDFDLKTFRSFRAGIYAVYEEYTRLIPASEEKNHTDKSSIITAVFKYINKNFKKPISLVSMARDLGYNPEYISHVLSSIDGMNFRLIVNSFRIDHAKSLLFHTKRTIPDIAAESGFSCERSMHRTFKALSGQTPGEYRKFWQTPAFKTGSGGPKYTIKDPLGNP